MANDAPIRTGIIGFGLSGRIFHAPFIATNPRFSLEVISTGDPARQAQAASAYPDADIVASPEELLARAGDLDLVVLASPAHTHRDQGIAAFAAGAAVVIDKPFAGSVAEAEELVAAADAAGKALMVFQNRRFDGDFLTVKNLIANGALGSVHRFESTFERWSPELHDRWQDTTTIAQGAGITFDLGSHLIDQALQLFGPATVVHAETDILRPGGVSDDEAFISLLHESGVRSHLTLSRFAGANGPRFRVLGSDAAYTVYGLDPQEASLVGGASPTDPGFGDASEEAWGRVGIAAAATPVPTETGRYAAFYEQAASALRDGGALPVDPLDALATMRAIAEVHAVAGRGGGAAAS